MACANDPVPFLPAPQLALIKDLEGKPDMKSAKEDWESDSNGKLEMNHGMFYNAIFELVDVWCEVSHATPSNTLWGRRLLRQTSGRGP